MKLWRLRSWVQGTLDRVVLAYYWAQDGVDALSAVAEPTDKLLGLHRSPYAATSRVRRDGKVLVLEATAEEPPGTSWRW